MKPLLLLALLAGGLWYWQSGTSAHIIDDITVAELPADTVVLFSTKTCGACKRTRTYFKEHGIEYVEYDMNRSSIAQQEYRKISSKRGVPLIYYKGEHVLGFNAARVDKLLNL